MRLEDFNDKVKTIKNKLLKQHNGLGWHYGLCSMLSRHINFDAKYKFTDLFCPKDRDGIGYWYGSTSSRISLWRRLRVLKKFQKICIKNKYYLEF